MKQCQQCNNKYLADDCEYCPQCGHKFAKDGEMPDFLKDLLGNFKEKE